MMTYQISLNPSSVVRALGAVAFLLVLASIGGQLTAYLPGYAHIHALVRLFYVGGEENIPTGFSTLLLLFAALLLAVITALKRKQSGAPVAHWAILAFGFLFMAADEAWSFHERLSKPVRRLLGEDTFGVFYYAWVIPGIALVLVLALFFSRFLLRLPAKTRLSFLTAAALYLAGAIGIELLGGRFFELHRRRNLAYRMIVTVEESLEMAGILIFIWALLVYIAHNYEELRFRFEGVRGEATIDAPEAQ